jgi:uncharacterized protein (TIGR03437 family)
MFRHALRVVLSLAALAAAIPAQTTAQANLGYTIPNPIVVAPGQVITLFVPALQGSPNAVANQLPLPTSLSGVSVAVQAAGMDTTGYPSLLPILRVDTFSFSTFTGITVEIPTEGVCVTPNPDGTCTAAIHDQVPPSLTLTVQSNGVSLQPMTVTGHLGVGHILNSCDTVFGPPGASCENLIFHADGTYVSASSPAQVSETIVVYGVGFGFGAPTGTPKTGYPAMTDIALGPIDGGNNYDLGFSYTTANGQSPTNFVEPSWAGLVGGYVGLYQINIVVPPAPAGTKPCVAPTANSSGFLNTILEPIYPGGPAVWICVQVPPAAESRAGRNEVQRKVPR